MTDKITPCVDVAFKKIFGVEENKDLLILLINSIVSKEDQVKEVTILNPYNPRDFKSDKLSILDIKAMSVEGKRYNIEIQISDEDDYDKRALYYWAKVYTQQLEKAEDYSKLQKAIGIHILNFISIPEAKKYHNVFNIKEKDSGIVYFKDLELHTIELKKFNSKLEGELGDFITKIKTSLDAWGCFLTKYDLLDKNKLPKKLVDAGIEKALNVLDEMNFTKKERELYEDHLKWLQIEANALKKAERKGVEKGMKQGREEGREERDHEVIINMLKDNFDIKTIAKITGVATDKILEIKKINKL